MFRLRKGTTLLIRSENGQMAIFVALIFQILFVLFAMIINVGLIVHDKINLQNSVDLAAFYGAQKQAEILNAIAHSNYQIRQAWKLLAWRVRVLGDLGNKENPNKGSGPTAIVNEAYINRLPVVCINHQFWSHVTGDDWCYKEAKNFHVTKLEPTKMTDFISPLAPVNAAIYIVTKNLANTFQHICEDLGPTNYGMAIRWIAGYRAQVAKSKERIRNLADQLKSEGGFTDIYGDSVVDGIRKTLEYNLTNANLESLGKGVSIYNSLGGRPVEDWLVPIPAFPDFHYADFSSDCKGSLRQVMKDSRPPTCGSKCDWMDGIKQVRSIEDPYQPVLGYEKNPWTMAYVGVRAFAKPTKPFLPFGKPITLTAVGFAKPFGGRIGPWMFNQWQPRATKSAGSFQNQIDKTLPEPPVGGVFNPAAAERSVPNYARFPGDTLGLSSFKSLAAMGAKLKLYVGKRIPYLSYVYIPNYDGDNLAQIHPDEQSLTEPSAIWAGTPVPWIRQFEMAAMAPDLFDITYYSIDPNYAYNFLRDGEILPYKQFNYDLGFLEAKPKQTGIKDQLIAINQFTDNGNNYFLVKEPRHLLTGWTSSEEAFKYPVGPDLFGTCGAFSKGPFPSGCASGGRVGYSVKVVSRDYLLSDEHEIGGIGVGSSQINNPPPENF